MLRKLIILGVCAGISAAVPVLYESNPAIVRGLLKASGTASAPDLEGFTLPKAKEAVQQPTGRKVLVRADERGHFLAEIKVNGRRVPAMVDTGATLVAMNRSTARALGIPLSPADFRFTVDTANGRTRAAAAMFPAIDIGRIHVENVEGVVLEDGALGQTLIGMSFLKRLDKFAVEDGVLLLSQ